MVLYIYIYVWTHLFSIQILLEDPQTESLAVTVMQAKNLNGSEGAMKPPGGVDTFECQNSHLHISPKDPGVS